jgi:site-specific DNA-methyltransferase (adenine-specific)
LVATIPGDRLRKDKGRKRRQSALDPKPEALLYRVILSASNPGDVVLDPFFGSGTTGAVAKRLHRNWIGLEREEKYIQIAQKRIDSIQPLPLDSQTFNVEGKRKSAPRVAFSSLLENGYLHPGQSLLFDKDPSRAAAIKPDARLRCSDGFEGTIHQSASHYAQNAPCNGWEHWYLQENGRLVSLDEVRERFRGEEAEK